MRWNFELWCDSLEQRKFESGLQHFLKAPLSIQSSIPTIAINTSGKKKKKPFWLFPNIFLGKSTELGTNLLSEAYTWLPEESIGPPNTHTHLTWSHYSSHHSWLWRGNEGRPKGSSGVAWQCAQTCCVLSVCYKALRVINSNQRNPFLVCNLIGLPQL